MDRDGNAARIVRPLLLGGVAVVFACIILTPPPRLPITKADGLYKNSCCLPVQLDRGKASVGATEFNYVIESDKEGAYILPKNVRVMADDSGLSIAYDSNPLKIRFSQGAQAKSLTIIGLNGASKRFVTAKL